MAAGLVMGLAVSACGGGEYTQEELDSAIEEAVEEAVEEALADVGASQPTTTSALSTTSTSTPLATTTTTVAPTTTATGQVELDESDPRNAAAVGGNAAPPLAVGEAGVLSVIQGGWGTSFGSTRITFVVRNNTDEQVKGIEAAFTVRDPQGSLLASGDTSDMYPYRVGPGEIAFGYGWLSDIELPDDAQFEFQLSSSDSSEQYDRQIDMAIQEHAVQGDKIIAILHNNTDTAVSLVQLGAMCFNEDGTVSGFDDSFADADDIAIDGTSPVTVDMRDVPCPIYLIAATGFGE